jgi:hypothetical protein
MVRCLLRKARSFLSQPLLSQFGFIPVWILLGAAKVLILCVSFRRLAPHLGKHAGISAQVPLLTPTQETRALQISRLVRLVARYTPWDSNCFPQAVIARLLLGWYDIPYVVYFGLMRDSKSTELKAHAWVATGRVRVTGGTSFGLFTVVSCFVSPGLEVPDSE